MENTKVGTNTNINKMRKIILAAIVIFFSYSATIIINPLQLSYTSITGVNAASQPQPSPSSTTKGPTNSKNITILDAKSLANNSKSSPIIPLGNVTINKIPKPLISTDIANVTEQPEPKAANLSSFAFSKMKAEISNASSTAPKKQFSINPFVSNSLNNKTSTNDSLSSSSSSDFNHSASNTRGHLTQFSSMIADTGHFNLADPLPSAKKFQIEGLSINTAGSLRRNPPDPQVAVGPNHIVEMVNLGAGFWLKSGAHLQTVDLSQLFKTRGDSISDPRVLYDNSTGRWFASIMDITDNSVVLSISQTSDPTTGSWTTYKLPFSGCPDQQKIGVSKDKVIVSANVVDDNCPTFGQYKGGLFIVLNKTDLLKGVNPSSHAPFVSKLIPTFFSLHPAEFVNSNESSAFFMVTLGEQGLYGGKTVTIYIVNGTVPNIQIKNLTLAIQPVEQPKSADQPGQFSPAIDTEDARVQDAHWQNGHLWLTANDRCIPTGDKDSRACIRLVEINTNNYSIAQDFDISLASSHLFYPALGIDRAGNLAVLFGYSSKILNYYPGVMIAGQSANGEAGKLENVVNITNGLSANNSDRYGDYNAIAIDPTNPMSFWGVAQRIPSPLTNTGTVYWSTFIGNFTALR
jgi:hypothetical protein